MQGLHTFACLSRTGLEQVVKHIFLTEQALKGDHGVGLVLPGGRRSETAEALECQVTFSPPAAANRCRQVATIREAPSWSHTGL